MQFLLQHFDETFGKHSNISKTGDTHETNLSLKEFASDMKMFCGQRSNKSLILVRNIEVGFLCLFVVFLTSIKLLFDLLTPHSIYNF